MSDAELERRIAATEAHLQRAAEARRVSFTPDGRLKESDAEQLVGYGAGSFRKYRKAGTAPTFYRVATAGSRVSYRIRDLAAWIEGRREECGFRLKAG